MLSISCEQNEFLETAKDPATKSGIQLKNGRLYFPDQQQLLREFNLIKDKDEVEIYNHMLNHYSYDNFTPLRPIATVENEEQIATQIAKRTESVNQLIQNSSYLRVGKTFTEDDIAENIDDLEDIIGDDAYASFLNSSAEIQVGDTIYKYTDVGLFSVRDTEYNALNDYLVVKSISTDLLVPTQETTQLQIINEIPNAGVTQLNDGITYFRATTPTLIEQEAEPNKSNFNQVARTSSIDSEVDSFVSSLTPCDGKNGFLGQLFGIDKVCIDKYESRRRVKTKAYSYNFKLVYSVATKVKHQYKGWTGIWRQEDTDVLGMGVFAAQFEYDFTKMLPTNTKNIDQSLRLYTAKGYNKIYKVSVDNYGGMYSLSVTPFTGNAYPFNLFNDDLVIENWGNSNIVDQALAQANKRLTSEKLNEYFWKTLYSQATTQLKNLTMNYNYTPPSNITLLSKHPTFGKLLVQKTHKEIRYNTSKVDKTYDWGFYLKVTLSAQSGYSLNPKVDGGGGAVYDASQSSPNVPKGFRVIMYGVAKRGGVWHGSRLELM